MTEDQDKALVTNFPNLYSHRRDEAHPIWWGLAVGEGWQPMIRELSAKLEALIVALPRRQRSEYFATQVKEKFGGLRFSMSKATPQMSALLDEAEKKSFETCESCSAPGTLRKGSWLTVACDPCDKAAKKR